MNKQTKIKNKVNKDIQDEEKEEYEYQSIDSFSLDFNCNFDAISIYVASPEDINAISKGEVTNTDTLNYRTLKPEKNGIFCSTIFGPMESYKCLCERYAGESYQGLRCERCNVIVGDRRLRRLYFGHIALNTNIVHPWFYNYIATILKMTKKTFHSILNYDLFIFIDNSKDGKYTKYSLVTANEYYLYGFLYPELESGGNAILKLLQELDLHYELKQINLLLKDKNIKDVSDKIIKRRDIIQAIIDSNKPITNVIISYLPVIPADTRPIIHLEGGGIATVEINEMYRKIINRNNRLTKLIEMETHRIILNNEKYMINQAIACFMGPQSNKNCKPIAEYIKGKKGYLRRSSLGKRTDFSGRASIVVGPELKIDECSIPIRIALELFKPFLYSKILKDKKAHSIIEAKKMIESDDSYVYRILEDIVQDFPIILNRAPTLHRLSLQAFKIKLNRSHAIKIPPLVCTGYAADFDGDQMACHLPITIASRIEAFSLMLTRHNLFLPSNGKLIISPTKDIIMGMYYLTLYGDTLNTKYPLSIDEAQLMNEYGQININTRINVVIRDINGSNIHTTNYGIIKVWQLVQQKHTQLDFTCFNKQYNKDTTHDLIMYIFHKIGWDYVLEFLNNITRLGFQTLTDSGISYTMSDIIELDMESKIQKIEQEIQKMQSYLDMGFIDEDEYDTQYMQKWHNFIEDNSTDVLEAYEKHKFNAHDLNNVPGNNIYLIYKSGARGSASQMQQVSGLRGFMSKMSGQISRFIIKSNLYKGLNIFEYFESTNGERKGLSDTAIKTSKAGHFTRRLVDVSHSIAITTKDCGTTKYMTIEKTQDRRKFNLNFKDAIFGKIIANDIKINNKTLIKKNTVINEAILQQILNSEVNKIDVYSSLYCNETFGICVKCYGIDFSTYKLVNIGCPVGMIAAQSVGEPGTQLTMRTTHTGGVASTTSSQDEIYVEHNGIVDLSQVNTSINSANENIVLTYGFILITNHKKEVLDTITVNHGYILSKKHGDTISKGEIITYINKSVHKIVSMYEGIVTFHNFIKDITVKEFYDESIGITRRQIISSIQYSDTNLTPYVSVYNTKTKQDFIYYLDEGYLISIQSDEYIKIGDAIAIKYLRNINTQDITGGLPKVIDIYEVKTHVNAAIIASHSGIVKITRYKKNKCLLIIDQKTEEVLSKIIIPNSRNITYQDNMYATKGTILVDGQINIQDLLDILGYDYTIKYIIGSISVIYEDQGVNINYKHIETIVKQMLKYGIVTKSSNSDLPIGKIMEYNTLLTKSTTDKRFSFKRVVIGVTKVSLIYYPSFISASSFQHTIPTISLAALANDTDYLIGIKENVIFNKRIPVGTGFPQFTLKD